MSLKLDELRKRLLQQAEKDATRQAYSNRMNGAIGAMNGEAAKEPREVREFLSPLPHSEPARSENNTVADKSANESSSDFVGAKPEASAKPQDAGSKPEDAAKPEVTPPVQAADISPVSKQPVEQPQQNHQPSPPPPITSLNALREHANGSGPEQLTEAVAKVFEQTRVFERQIQELCSGLNVVEGIGDSAAQIFEPLKGFHEQLLRFGKSLEAMRAFQAQIAEVGESFEPMKVLYNQMTLMVISVREHLAELVKALDPVREFAERVNRLAVALEPIEVLRTEFNELSSVFSLQPLETGQVRPIDGDIVEQSAAQGD